MNRLLKIELKKVLNYRIAKVFLIIYLLMIIASSLILSQEINFFGLNISMAKMGIFNFPDVWHFVTYYSAFLKLFLAIIVITTIANEYNYGTVKQNLIDGLTKKEFLTSKVLSITLFSLTSTLLVFILALLFGLFYSDAPFEFTNELLFIPAYFLKLMAFLSFCMFLCFLLRKSALSLGLIFIWWIAESAIYVMEKVATKSIENYDFTLSNYLPLSAMSHLIPSPLGRINSVSDMTMGMLKVEQLEIQYLLIAILYIILFIYLSYWLLKRKDL